jgi:hypothetical protein
MAYKRRGIARFARPQKVNGQNLPFASMALYSGHPAQLASLRSEIFFANRENSPVTSGHYRHQVDMDGE